MTLYDNDVIIIAQGGKMCLNCKKDGYNNIFEIKGRRYGSIFDTENIKFNLCDDCIKELKVKNVWFDELANENGEYLYEDKLENLIHKIGVDKILLTNICSSDIIKTQNKKR